MRRAEFALHFPHQIGKIPTATLVVDKRVVAGKYLLPID